MQSHRLAGEYPEEGFGSHSFPMHHICMKEGPSKLFEMCLNAWRDSSGLNMFENPRCKAIVVHYTYHFPTSLFFQSALNEEASEIHKFYFFILIRTLL